MSRQIVIGLGITWAVVVAAAAALAYVSNSRGMETFQVVLVGVLPLLVGLLVSNRLVQMARGSAQAQGTRPRPQAPRQLSSASSRKRERGSRAFLLFGRRRPSRQAAEASRPSPAVAIGGGRMEQRLPDRPEASTQVASARQATPARESAAPAAAPPPKQVREAPASPTPSPVLSPAGSAEVVGADAAQRIRAIQTEVERLHLRLEEELERLNVARAAAASSRESQGRMLNEVRLFLQKSTERNRLLLEEAGRTRGALEAGLASLRRMLEEVETISAALRAELAQASALARFMEGLEQQAPATAEGGQTGLAPQQHLAPSAPLAAQDTRPVPEAGPGAEIVPPLQEAPGPAPAAQEVHLSVQARPGPEREDSLQGALADLFAQESPSREPGEPARAPHPAAEQATSAQRPAAAVPEESLLKALEEALGGRFGDGTPDGASKARREAAPQPASAPRAEAAAGLGRGLDQELADVLGRLSERSQAPPSREAQPGGNGQGKREEPALAGQVALTSEQLTVPFTGTFYITVRPLLGGPAFGGFWTALEKVVGVGRVVGSTPMRDRSGIRLTIDMARESVSLTELVSGIPDAEFQRVDEQNLEVTLAPG